MSDLREDTKKRVALAEEEPIYSMPKKKDRTKKKSREKGNQLFPSDVSGSEKHERIYAMEKVHFDPQWHVLVMGGNTWGIASSIPSCN